MKVLIVSDAHANPWALEAVERDVGPFDHVLFAGDAVNYGPEPRRTIAWLREQGAIAVLGNHDHAVAFTSDPRANASKQALALAMRDWTWSALSYADRMWLERLPICFTWETGGTRFVVCHATPCDPLFDYRFTPDAPEALADELLKGVDGDVLVVGHTHLAFVRRCGAIQVVNPGSVGQPLDGDPRAAYALWTDGHVTLHRATYDVSAAVAGLDHVPIEAGQRAALARTLITGKVG